MENFANQKKKQNTPILWRCASSAITLSVILFSCGSALADKANPDFVPPEITLPYASAPSQSVAAGQAQQAVPGQAGQGGQTGGAQPGFAGFQIPNNLGQSASAPGMNPFLMKGADRLRQPPGTQFASKSTSPPGTPPAGAAGAYPGSPGYPGQGGQAPPAQSQGASLSTQINMAAPRAVIATSKGNITIMLFKEYAPITVGAFMDMARSGFYNGLTFHRVEPGFVIQGGDPKGNGSGFFIPPGSNQPRYLPLETSPKVSHNAAGVVAMAHLPGNPNSSSCQFYITLKATKSLDGQYTIIGGVEQGMDVVNRITIGDRIDSITVSQ